MDPHEKYRVPVNTPSAPPVPRELMSARPAMTKVVPRSPDSVRAASQATQPVGPAKPLTPEEEAERQQRIDYLRKLRDKETGRGGKGKVWWTIVIIILLLIAGGIAFALWEINKPAKVSPGAATANTDTQQPAETPAQTAPTTEQKDYESTNFALSLKYPGDWTLNDAATALTIISPVQQLPGADGQAKSGAVVVTIRHKQASLPEFKAGNAVAVLDSKNVTYTAPSEGQRGTTFLSYLQYASTTTKGALDAIYITGNAGYKKTQAIPQADAIKVDPLITVHFVECASGCTPTTQSTQVNGETWQASTANTTVETILKSLAFN